MSSLTKLLDLINTDNPAPYPLTVDNVTLSDPVPDSSTIRNTKVTISATPDNGLYTGHVDVFYDRININEAVDGVPGFMSENPITEDFIILELNNKQATDLDASDLETVSIPDMSVGDIGVIELVASPTSLAWVGTGSVSVLYGLPYNTDKLHQLVNFTLPTDHYLSPN